MSIKTKLLSALLSTLFMGATWLIPGILFSGGEPFTVDDFGFILIILMYTGFGNLIYGIPVSFLSDWISNKAFSLRFIIAAFIHLSLAIASYIVIEEMYIFAVLAATFFLAAEEWQHRKIRKFRMKSFVGNTLFILVLFVGIWGFSQLDLREKTHRQYLIPQGYEGVILVRYNVSGEPGLLKEDGEKVIQVTKKEQVYSNVGDVIHYGEAQTSSKEPDGLIEDTYYYINKKGDRTAIDESCVHRRHFHMAGGKEVVYESFQVTKTDCGEDFSLNGSDLYDQQEDQIIVSDLE